MESRLYRKILYVKGMVCNSCERKITNKLSRLYGVKDVEVVLYNSTVCVIFDNKYTDLNSITRAIEDIGYSVEKTIRNKNNKESGSDWVKLFSIITVVYLGYLIIQNTVGFKFIPQVGKNATYSLLFLTGLFSSLHCIAMCGGISLSQGLSGPVGNNSALEKLKPSAAYNLGRVISYTLIGGIVGLIGSGLSLTGRFRSVVVIIAGVFMIFMGLSNVLPTFKRFNVRLPKFLTNRVHKVSSGLKGRPFYVGLLNGLMPCGPLQAMQLYALTTGSFAIGVLSMFVFSLGTTPLMLGIGSLGAFINKSTSQKIFKVSSVLVIILGLVMINRGFALSGITFETDNFNKSTPQAVVDGYDKNVQVIRTTLLLDKYEPRSFSVKSGVSVRWIIDAQELNLCNSQLLIPSYNIQRNLEKGENIIEFTPTGETNIRYSCPMGMIEGKIRVEG